MCCVRVWDSKKLFLAGIIRALAATILGQRFSIFSERESQFMFAGDLDSILNPVITLGIGGLIGGVFVLAVALSIWYIVYAQAKKDRSSEH